MNGLQLTPSQRLPVVLMGVVAVWALIFSVAGLTGLGGRYGVHPDDPARVPPLPALDLSRAKSPLQAVETYAVIGERPLFNSDRKPVPVEDVDASQQEVVAAPDVPLEISVTSIMVTPTTKLAIITDNKTGKSVSLKVGESLEGDQSGWKLVELEGRNAVFSGPSGNVTAELRVFDGSGGQAPTPVATTPATQENVASDAAQQPEATEDAPKTEVMTPETRAEMIRRRIEERRRQMREEAERANNK